MTSNELRTKYLEFFKSKGHLIHPSDSLVPDDPSLLYTSAGMVQFKPYFLAERVPPCTRIATSQKCMRTDDIDEVGDAVHHTFFEMLGNFSFGDYFKKETIIWAWEFLTQELKLNPDNIWTSVYIDDEEAYNIWVNDVKFPENRIVRLGEDKNYWPANAPSKGPNGVCGPCNEIFLDVNPSAGQPEDPAWSIAYDSNRFVEIWNLVFTQFERQEGGELKPLPNKNIDTGMGLERTIAILQGTPTNYETDLFMPIIRRIEELSGAKYGSDDSVNLSIRVIADHIRSAVFALADGVMPSNIGRGYVLRRLIRNAVVKGRRIGLLNNFMATVMPTVIKLMGEAYPELVQRQAYIDKVISSEEDKFRRTLDAGLSRLEDLIKASSANSKIIDGDSAFALYDTYGFPLEITKEVAKEAGVEIDIDGFNIAMAEQKKRAKEASGFGSVMSAGGDSLLLDLEKSIAPTTFTGYECLEYKSTVLAIIKDGEIVQTAEEGDKVDIILDSTPFYAETGGQVGDSGVIFSDTCNLAVTDTQKASFFFMHKVIVKGGSISIKDEVNAQVDFERRMAITRNHSATHLLHSALRKVVGDHALQAGSLVTPERLRFDFSHFQAVTQDEIRQIEIEVNSIILADEARVTEVVSIDDARKMGANALFGEKYGDIVRVVRIGETSLELCGGTHLCHTSQVGLFKIISESSVGAGLRRIEAVTGSAALRFVHEQEDIINCAANAIGSSIAELIPAGERLVAQVKDLQMQIGQIKSKEAASKAGELADLAVEINSIKTVITKIDITDVPTLQKLADGIIDKLKSGVVLLAGVDEKIIFICKASKDVVEKGVHCGNIVRDAAKLTGGGGGGRPDFAQAGGRDISKLDEAMAKAPEIIANML